MSPPTRRIDLVAALAQATREISSSHDLPGVLDTIVHAVRRSCPGVDHAGISVKHKDGTIETLAATDPLVTALDDLQYQLGEGPCLSAIFDETPVVTINDAARETRWPSFIPPAVELGLRSQLGLRLYVENTTMGGLNLYSTVARTIDPDVLATAELFAASAALALGKARQEEDLYSALSTRKVIGQALGLLMERYELDEDRAFQYLARVSQHSNHKLRDVAAEMVQQANERNRLPEAAPRLMCPPQTPEKAKQRAREATS
jgi:GAF domain-containing protein